LKAFFVAALSTALDLGIAAPDDVLRHATPDVLATHLPRPLWARIFTACLGAGRIDAQLVVDTVGVTNLCEHVPAQIIWDCIREVAARSLDGVVIAAPNVRTTPTAAALIGAPAPAAPRSASAASAPVSRPMPLSTPPPPPAAEPRPVEARPPVALGPSIPAPTAETESDRGRVAPGQRFRPSNTSMGRMATNAGTQRRPQAYATPPEPPPPPAPPGGDRPGRVRRGQTEADFDLETFVGGKDDWKATLAVEDEQLVDWSASDETVSGDDLDRKR
jgi:hypothetical protein